MKYLMFFVATMVVHSMALAGPSSTEVVFAELDKVDVGRASLVVAGNTYRYQLKAEESSYKSSQDLENGLSLRDLKPGNSYYFEFYTEGENVKSSRYSDIIFISESAPSE